VKSSAVSFFSAKGAEDHKTYSTQSLARLEGQSGPGRFPG
jgi:hypothetical protein